MAIQQGRPRIRIVSKGSGPDTEVFLIGEDGTETLIPDVVRVTWTCAIDRLATATLELVEVEIDAIGEQDDSSAADTHDE